MHDENTVFRDRTIDMNAIVDTSPAIDPNRVDECRRIHGRLVRLAKQRAALDACEARDLRYAEEIGIWEVFGYTTMFAYMESALGYSPHTAGERLRVSRALVEVPLLAEKLAAGEILPSAVRELIS